MSSSSQPASQMQTFLSQFRQALHSFSISSSTFQVLRTLPIARSPPVPKTLYVLDSSFNPPTLAHLRIATSALLQDHRGSSKKRLLLLLATQNADKAPKPASFEQRLVMMTIFAQDLLDGLPKGDKSLEGLVVDVGVTKEPYYVDKATAIARSGIYSSPDSETEPEQVHILGFDSITRLLNPKYYPPTHTLEPLDSLFAKHRLRITHRTDDEWGGRNEQEEYLDALRDGKREAEGGKREWAGRIELVEGRKEGEEVISSTKVRDAAKRRDKEALEILLTKNVANWVLEDRLYVEEGRRE